MLKPTLSGAAIVMGDKDCISQFTGIKQSHGFLKNFVLFSEVFIRTGEVLENCISNSTDIFSKKIQNLYILSSKV